MDQVNLLEQELGAKLRQQVVLAPFTTLKIGGPADWFYEATTKDELVRAVTCARRLGMPVFILGGGSNVLIGDRGFRGLVVRNLTRNISVVGLKGQLISGKRSETVFVAADSGAAINSLVRFTVDEGLAGLEMHLGLPGSVGGAIYMNSKWTHPVGYVGDAVSQVTLITRSGEQKTVPQSYFRFAYDTSCLQITHETVVSVVFALQKSNKEKLWAIANESINYRRTSQPTGVVTAGCTFRNLSETEAHMYATPNHTQSAGFLIDRAGLKGVTVGKVQISPLHANFFLNLGGGTARDMVKLIETARTKVKEKFRVNLREEVERIGEF